MKPYEPIDRNGKTIRVGDIVRIVGVPDLSGMRPDCLEESLPVFEYLIGKYKRVSGFDDYGNAEISFRLRNDEGYLWHIVWLEPWLLQVPQSRKSALNILKKTEFIGSAEGPADLSENYKHHLDFDKSK
ncbi:MAG: hypothetical protein ACAI44_30820 [Candidatus Sericytochromatia bacterium]